MQLFDVYPLFDVTPVRGKGCYVYDQTGVEYLDLYGGHAVISIGHTHPHFVESLKAQIDRLVFYSNSVQNPLQSRLATKLGQVSACDEYQLFLCNSGAEANENALKLASFSTGKKKVIAFNKAFHGRTSVAVNATDNEKIKAPINKTYEVDFLPLNDLTAVEASLHRGDVCAVIVEGIQGIGGVYVPRPAFLQGLEKLCKKYGAVFILDEIQSGFGRSGRFFAFQYAGIEPDLITMAKGMGNGFPIGGVLIHPKFKAQYGMLGTTFGGNHLACAASLAVLEVIEKESLMQNAEQIGAYFFQQLVQINPIKEVRGKGLMIGIEMDFPIKPLRKQLLFEEHIFTGSAANPNTFRLLPPLNIQQKQVDYFVETLKKVLFRKS